MVDFINTDDLIYSELDTEEAVVNKPQIRQDDGQTDTYGRFTVEPLEPGFGTTLGNPMRRVLLTSIPGTAVTWVKIEDVLHEYSTIPHMKEDVSELLLNIKNLRLKSLADRSGKLRLDVSKEGEITAKDIDVPSDFEIVNPDLHLATMDSGEQRLEIEFNVDQGKGYVPAGSNESASIGRLPVDAIFSPVLKVNYTVENTRVGQITNYERLILDVWTDGSVSPVDAVKEAADNLLNQLFLFANADKAGSDSTGRPSFSTTIPMAQYNTPIEKLDLSSRTINCLKRSNINKVGQVLEIEKPDLLKIRNFGQKSLDELYEKLALFGFIEDPDDLQTPSESPAVEEDPQDQAGEA